MDKLAVVTGGANGIGRAISEKLLSSGYQILVIDRDKPAMDELQSYYPQINCLEADFSRPDIEPFLEKELNTCAPAALVNNVGVFRNIPMSEMDFAEWNSLLQVNLGSAYLLVRILEKSLRKNRGAVVNIASTRAIMSQIDTECYSAAKGGLVALTHAQAMSLSPDVRVNCISPGWIKTGEYKLSETDHSQHPAGRVGTPTDIAELAHFLLSDKAGFITGQNFISDGGMTRKMIYSE